MKEILAGLFHWTAKHPRIHVEVSSYWLEDGGVLIDPLVPEDVGIEWFAERPVAPAAIVLSNRHHFRHSADFQAAFGCPVYCRRTGLHEFTHGEQVTGFDPGEQLPGGILAHEVGGLSPDETALYLPGVRALAFADSIVRARDGAIGFVSDRLMDDPPETKRALLAAFARLLEELDFEHLLLAHGGPLLGDGRARLQELVDVGGRAAF